MRLKLAFLCWFVPLQVWATTNVSFVADGTYSSSATSPVSVSIPNGSISNGQLMVMINYCVNTGGCTVTTPSGWTYYNDIAGSAGSFSEIVHGYVFYRYANNEGSSVSVSATGTFGGGNEGVDGTIRVYKNTATSNPIGAWATVTSASGTGTNQTITIPAISETYHRGELYFVMEACGQNVTITSGNFSPAINDYYTVTGFNTIRSQGDYNPSSSPVAEVMNSGSTSVANVNDEHGIGLQILPLPSNLDTVGAGQ